MDFIIYKRTFKNMTHRQLNSKLKRLTNEKNQDSKKTIEDLLQLMELKASMGTFQSFNPKDFGADYNLVPIPKDETLEANYWFGVPS